MEGPLSERQEDTTPPASHPENVNPRRKTRNRTTTACNACRGRRTRCDGRRPACGYCRIRGLECHYEHSLSGPRSRVETELAAINQRLDHITGLLPRTQQPSIDGDGAASRDPDPGQGSHLFTVQEKSPFQLLATECMMTILGLDAGFNWQIVKLERNSPPVALGNTPRIRFIQQQQALAALAAFSAHVHIWYPILRPGFSERYLRIISGSLTPGPESCLVLLVAALGMFAQQKHGWGATYQDNDGEVYLEAALGSLPAVLVDSSPESVQSLLLLSVYYCCLSKPCQAYDYVMVASFKVQNLLKYMDTSDDELYEQVKRAYWAVLLLESELRAQFDVVDSGIWDHDDQIALPDSRRAWQFDVDVGSPQSPTTPPASNNTSVDNVRADTTQSYFLAEISMRRMLHRCNTAIRKTTQGEIVYAPGIALELELQLDEWYGYLPNAVRFVYLDFDLAASLPRNLPPSEPLSNFLRVQYYCCKMSIYWPAVYQCIQDDTATSEIPRHCERFFQAYIRLMPSLLMAVRDCIVNRWTLYGTIFTTSMAVIQASRTPCLRDTCEIDWSHLQACLESTRAVDREIIEASPSLLLLDSTLAQRLTEIHGAPRETDGPD